jgi:hypothetical protein
MGVIAPESADWLRTAVNRSKHSFRKIPNEIKTQTRLSPEKSLRTRV